MSILDELEFTTAERVGFCGKSKKHSPHDTGAKTGCPGATHDVLSCKDTKRHVPHIHDEFRCLGYVRDGVIRNV